MCGCRALCTALVRMHGTRSAAGSARFCRRACSLQHVLPRRQLCVLDISAQPRERYICQRPTPAGSVVAPPPAAARHPRRRRLLLLAAAAPHALQLLHLLRVQLHHGQHKPAGGVLYSHRMLSRVTGRKHAAAGTTDDRRATMRETQTKKTQAAWRPQGRAAARRKPGAHSEKAAKAAIIP